jgi:hypothetical protein
VAVKRLKDFEKLDQIILTKAYDQVKHIYKDGKWRNFKGTVKFRDRFYNVEFGFMLDGLFMNIVDKKITLSENGQERRIIIPPGVKH